MDSAATARLLGRLRQVADRMRPGPCHEPRIARRLARHFRRVTGVRLALPCV